MIFGQWPSNYWITRHLVHIVTQTLSYADSIHRISLLQVVRVDTGYTDGGQAFTGLLDTLCIKN